MLFAVCNWLIGSHLPWTKIRSNKGLTSYEWSHLVRAIVIRAKGCLSQSPLSPTLLEFPLCMNLTEICSLMLASSKAPTPNHLVWTYMKLNLLMGFFVWCGCSRYALPCLTYLGKLVPNPYCFWRNCHPQQQDHNMCGHCVIFWTIVFSWKVYLFYTTTRRGWHEKYPFNKSPQNLALGNDVTLLLIWYGSP